MVDVLGFYAFSILKAMSTVCVSSNELGKINALLAAIEGLMPAPIAQIYASLWTVSLKKLTYLLRLKCLSTFSLSSNKVGSLN